MQYKAVTLVKRPELTITPDLFETLTLETPDLEDGQFLLKQTHMSLDPAMKGWMTDDRNSYIPPVELGEIMRSSGVAEVVESKHEGFAVGDRVVGMIGWTEYAVSDGQGLNKLPRGISAEAVLCVLSLPGLTAYQGLMEIGKPKAGETLVVSGAAGSVGSMVGQLAKAEGLTVIGTAGSDDKCRWLEDELGFDKAINYKSQGLAEKIQEATPQGVDLYFENVEPGDVYVLCSDGLNGMVGDDRILDIVHNSGSDVEMAAKALVAQANQNGGEDNTTVVVVRITE